MLHCSLLKAVQSQLTIRHSWLTAVLACWSTLYSLDMNCIENTSSSSSSVVGCVSVVVGACLPGCYLALAPHLALPFHLSGVMSRYFSVSLVCRLNFGWPSPAQCLAFGSHCDPWPHVGSFQVFSLFWNGASSSTRGGVLTTTTGHSLSTGGWLKWAFTH
jgi:hypothetical protein